MKSPNQRVNLLLNSGGLGDRIATLPAIIYALKNFDHVSMDIFCPDYFVPLGRHFLTCFNERVDVMPISTMAATLNQTLPSIVIQNNYVTTLRRHLVDHAFDIINDTSDVPLKAKNYPKLRLDDIDTFHFKFPVDYVVLTPGFTAPVRALPARTWNQLARWITSRGVTPVWIGAKADTIGGALHPPSEFVEGVDYSVGIDLRDKTTLLEAGKIIALSKAIVGVDNGLIHLAGTTDVPIIAGFTSVDPKTRLPFRAKGITYAVVPPDFLECKFRQTRTHYDYQTDFRECPCGTECIDSLTAEKFIIELEKLI